MKVNLLRKSVTLTRYQDKVNSKDQRKHNTAHRDYVYLTNLTLKPSEDWEQVVPPDLADEILDAFADAYCGGIGMLSEIAVVYDDPSRRWSFKFRYDGELLGDVYELDTDTLFFA